MRFKNSRLWFEAVWSFSLLDEGRAGAEAGDLSRVARRFGVDLFGPLITRCCSKMICASTLERLACMRGAFEGL